MPLRPHAIAGTSTIATDLRSMKTSTSDAIAKITDARISAIGTIRVINMDMLLICCDVS